MTYTPFARSMVLGLFVAMSLTGRIAAQSDQTDRVEKSTTVFEEIMGAPDSAIPGSVLGKAEAIAVFPSTVKAGFIFGGHRGRGIISVRDRDGGRWSPPAFLTLTGGSFGLQIGGQTIDIVLVIMNRGGLERLLGNQFKIGADASVAAGPVGRDAEASTDIQLRAEILSYSRTRGLFAGVTLKGSAIRQDRDGNEEFYGRQLGTREVVIDELADAPASADAVARWHAVLERYVE